MKAMLITGASSGVGRSLTHHFAGRFRVIAAARRLDRMQEEFGSDPNVSCYAVDLGDPDDVARFCQRVSADHVHVTHVVNNAGVNRRQAVSGLDREVVLDSIQVNALAPLQIMQAFLPEMRDRGYGRIINVTSGAPLNCFAEFGAYSGSKALLNALTVTAAREEQDRDIRINLMSPGPVRSEMSPSSDLDPSVCHPTADYLVDLPADGPTGRFFWMGYEVPLFPDLEGVDWLAGDGGGKLSRAVQLERDPSPGTGS